MRRKLIIGLGALVALVVLLLLGSVLYLKFGDLSRHRELVERLVTDALGRELTIGGRFEPRIGFTSSVVASDVALANPEWSDEPAMVHVDELAFTIDLRSLLSGPIYFGDVEVQGARVRIEVAADGRTNWDFDLGEPGKSQDSDPVHIVFDRVAIDNSDLVYDDARLEQPLELHLSRLGANLAQDEMIDVHVNGRLDGEPVEIRGSISVYDRLFAGRDVEHDLTARVGDIEVTLRGVIGKLATLEAAELNLEAHGPDIAQVGGRFGLPALGAGPFRLSATSAPGPAGVDVTLSASRGELSLESQGTVGELLEPDPLDLELTASGPDLEELEALAGIDGLPTGPFEVSGRVRRDGSAWTFERVEARVAENTLFVDGHLGELPSLLGTDVTCRADGPDLSEFAELAGVELPAASYEAEAHLVRRQNGIEVDGLTARVGDIDLKLGGLVGDPPHYAGTDLEIHATGADLSVLNDLAGIELPAKPFEIGGHLTPGESAIALESVEARLGQHRLHLEGELHPAEGLVGTDLRLEASGPDLSEPAGLAGLTDLPAEAYDVAGAIRVLTEGYELQAVEARLGDLALEVDGRLGAIPELVGSDLRARIAGSDLSWLGALVDRPALPTDSYEVTGRARVLVEGYELEGLQVRVGDINLGASGLLGRFPDLDGTDLALEVRGPNLSALAGFVETPPLPAERFSVSGEVSIQQELYHLNQVVAELGDHRLSTDGTLGPLPDLTATELSIELSGPDLAEVGRMATEAGLGELPTLSAQPYSVTGRIGIEEGGYRLDDVAAQLGGGRLRLHGRVGAPPELLGTDVTVEAQGQDGSVFAELAGASLPQAPFRVHGRLQRTESGVRFDELLAEYGDHRAEIDGSLGDPPTFVGTRLDFAFKGPSLALAKEFVDLPPLPMEPFEISGHFDGTPEQLTLEDFTAELGESDLSGSFRLDLRDKLDLRGTFSSRRFDVTSLRGEPGKSGKETDSVEQGETAANAGDEPDGRDNQPAEDPKDELLLSDDPLVLDGLDGLNADVTWTANEVITAATVLSDVTVGLRLQDGHLELDPLTATGDLGGSVNGSLGLEPVGDDHRLQANLVGRQLRPDLASPEDASAERPAIDFELELTGIGRSPHEIAGNADGRLTIVMSEGRVDNSAVELLAADLLREVLSTLNPFAKEDPYTTVECGVLAVELVEGRARLDPLAIRTDKMTIVGSGKINFENENLDLNWAAKPRKGIGLSASAITNPYVKLGGTLSDPALDIKPLTAVTATGAAVATMGLSFLARGMWDRATAEKKVCKKALKEIERREAKASATDN